MIILVALRKIAAAQTSEIIETEKAIQKLPDYCTTYTDATLWYKARGVILKVHINEFYLSELQASNITGVFFYMGGATDGSS